MIGVIVTGHGGFASGLEANVKMLAGSDARLTAIDFAEGLAPEALEEKLAAAMDACAAECVCTLVLTDIAGGTPFNRAATLSVARPTVRVLSGTNASMLMDVVMRNITEEEVPDVDALCAELMETARENVSKFVLEAPAADEPGDDEDGI